MRPRHATAAQGVHGVGSSMQPPPAWTMMTSSAPANSNNNDIITLPVLCCGGSRLETRGLPDINRASLTVKVEGKQGVGGTDMPAAVGCRHL